MHKLHKYLAGNNSDTKVIVASNFFNNEQKTDVLRDYCKRYNASFVFISDIISDEENLPTRYEHKGIRIHPGDNGMKIIAGRILDAFYNIDMNKFHII